MSSTRALAPFPDALRGLSRASDFFRSPRVCPDRTRHRWRLMIETPSLWIDKCPYCLLRRVWVHTSSAFRYRIAGYYDV